MGILDERVAIVTGSARGIGRATAELLSEAGARVVISDIDGDAARATAAEIGGDTVVHVGDLTEDGEPEALVRTAIDEWGQLDILINNAGYALDGVVHKLTDESYLKMLDIHAVVPFQMIRAAAPYLREPAKAEREQGIENFRKVVNVSSVAGTMGAPGQANYAAGKAAVVGLTKTVAKEWAQFKINVNAVAFGWVETRLTGTMDEENAIEIGGERVQLGIPQKIRDTAPSLSPLGRPASARDAAGGIFLLCTPWANFIHGQLLNVTGGQAIGMGS
jgi:3-oxoacyl-[acyl-carrier protein] reductase